MHQNEERIPEFCLIPSVEWCESLVLVTVTLIGAFLLAFKSVLVEGSEVAILALATIKQLGKKNVLTGVTLGGLGSIAIFLIVRQLLFVLSLIPGLTPETQEVPADLVTGCVILYFSYRFLRGFVKYYFGGKSFRAKMEKMSSQVVEEDLKRSKSMKTGNRNEEGVILGAPEQQVVNFSFSNSLPVLSITLTEGFEASLVLGAASSLTTQAPLYVLFGAVVSLLVLIGVCAVSYDYLMRVPRWLLDLIAGIVLLSFGSYFLGSGLFTLVAHMPL
jgi:uncharacterized membrane protein